MKSDKYLDLARELKKTMEHEGNGDSNWNWHSFCGHQKTNTGTGGFEKKRRMESIQTTALVKSTRIIRRVLETCGELLSLRFKWKTISVNWCEKRSNE